MTTTIVPVVKTFLYRNLATNQPFVFVANQSPVYVKLSSGYCINLDTQKVEASDFQRTVIPVKIRHIDAYEIS